MKFYICNKKKSCNTSVSCGNDCKHTLNKDYAKYEEHEFERDEFGDYWEIEQRPSSLR